MKIDKKRNLVYFFFENTQEEIFLFNTLYFASKILEEQKKEAKKTQKEMYKKIKKILEKVETNILLQKLNEYEYFAQQEDIEILLDNALFIIKDLKEDKAAENMKESYNLIEELKKEILSYIKENQNNSLE
jgi:hypothetical protein